MSFVFHTLARLQPQCIRPQEHKVRALIVDLRDNPGGQVGAGLDVAQQVLPSNSVFVSVSGRGGAAQDVMVPQSDATLPSVPMVRRPALHDAGVIDSALHNAIWKSIVCTVRPKATLPEERTP
jgi:hypothetical protein